MQEFVGVTLDPQEAEENIYTHACNSGIYVEEELSEYVDSVGSDVINDTFSCSFTKPSDWSNLQLTKWGHIHFHFTEI